MSLSIALKDLLAIEAGEQRLGPAAMERACLALDVTVAYFFNVDVEKPSSEAREGARDRRDDALPPELRDAT